MLKFPYRRLLKSEPKPIHKVGFLKLSNPKVVLVIKSTTCG
jgi:hypothetical protein